MTKLVLAEIDRVRYDIPGEIEYVPGQWGFKTVDLVEKTTGKSLDRILAGMQGFPIVKPDGSETIKVDLAAWVAFVWLIVRDAGHQIAWDDFDLRGFPQFVADEVGDEGKAEDPDTSKTTDPA